MAFNGRRNFTSGNGNESEDDKLKRLQVTCRNIIYKPQTSEPQCQAWSKPNHNLHNRVIFFSFRIPIIAERARGGGEEESRDREDECCDYGEKQGIMKHTIGYL